MRKSRFTDEQIVAILRECDRTSVAEAAKKHKVSEQTIYVWRKSVGPIPALWLPPHPHLSAPGGSCHGHQSRTSTVAPSGPRIAAQTPRRRLAASRPRPSRHGAANHVWAYDFVFDYCANGQQLKCLTVVDEFTHECLAIDVAGSIRSGRVIDVLTRLMSAHGPPAYLRSDSGPEFVSHAILQWLTDAHIETAIIDPGKPWQNGTNESFNGKFRDECLSVEWFRTRREAQIIIEAWRRHFNAVRPHSSLAYLTPHEFKLHHPPVHDQPNRAISQE